MKKILSLLLVTLLFIKVYSQDNAKTIEDLKSYPPYENVVDYFFDNYKVPLAQLVKIDKTPQGWNLKILDAGDFETVSFESPLWTFSNHSWIDAPVEKDESDKSEMKEKFLRINPSKWYSIYPFYGYQGWDIDVIRFLENKTQLSDTLLYALGRSYSILANRQIRNQFGFGSVQNRDYRYEKVDKQITDSIILLSTLAIDNFRKVKDQNPNFQTIVGDINTKMSNEWMTTYHTLKSLKEDDMAKTFVVKDLYDPLLIESAQNYLKSCDSNAVLLTNGDNDTYPLWYVQEQYGFRPDVHVINNSLLNTDWYFEMVVDEAKKKGQGDLFRFEVSDFYNDQLKFAYIYADSDTAFNLSDLKEYLINEENLIEFNADYYPALPSKKLFLIAGDQLKDTMVWNYPGRYMMRSSLLILDLIAYNINKRPISFAVTSGSSVFQGLDSYLRLEGMAYRLTADYKEKSDYSGWVGIEQTHVNMMKSFDYTAFKSVEANKELASKMVSVYRTSFFRLAEEYISQGNNKEAGKVVSYANKVLSPKEYAFGFDGIRLVEVYYQLNKTKKANKLLLQLAENQNPNSSYELRGLYYMIDLAKKYDQEKIMQAILDKVNDGEN